MLVHSNTITHFLGFGTTQLLEIDRRGNQECFEAWFPDGLGQIGASTIVRSGDKRMGALKVGTGRESMVKFIAC